MKEVEYAPRAATGTAADGQGARAQQGTAIINGNITQRNFLVNQDLLFKSKDKAVGHSHAQQRLEGEAWPQSQSRAESSAGSAPGGAGAQELSTGQLTANRHPEHAAAPLTAPPSPSAHRVRVLPSGTIIPKKGWSSRDEPLGGGGAFRRSPAGSCAQRAVTPAWPQLTLLVPKQLQSFTLAAAVEAPVHVRPSEHREAPFPSYLESSNCLRVWFAAAEANAPAPAQCCSHSTAAHLGFTHLAPLLQPSTAPC